jgi:hypothetical protein
MPDGVRGNPELGKHCTKASNPKIHTNAQPKYPKEIADKRRDIENWRASNY